MRTSFLFLFFLFPLFAFMGPAQAQISADFWSGGGVRVGPSTTLCDSGTKGLIRYDDVQSLIKFCDGTVWRTVGSIIVGGDNTPDAFNFTDLIDQSLAMLTYSDTITITGIDPDVVVNVTGAGSPEISINNGIWGTTGFISAGDTLRVRQISAATISTARVANVTVGTASTNWSVMTRAGALIIFATNNSYIGSFGGTAAADAICQNQAVSAGLAGVYKSFLADSGNTVASRLMFAYPIVNTLGGIVFSSDILNHGIETTVRRADGATTGAPYNVWTGMLPGGATSTELCSDWTATSGTGRHPSPVIGQAPSWLAPGSQSCANQARLLCLQQ